MNSWDPSSNAWSSPGENEWASEGFWASYSDLMAGVLMIFALASTLFIHRALETTEILDKWRDVKQQVCNDPELQNLPGVHVNCDTGAIEFQVNDWFDFNSAVLRPHGKTVLRQVMPRWLGRVTSDATIWASVEALEFQGHADRRTADKHANMAISAQRSLAVRAFLIDEGILSPAVEHRAIIVGLGDRDFPEADCPSDECAQARRVVVRLNLNESSVLRDLLSLFKKKTP